ncbi:hypothetical protein BN79_029 [Yersinia phage phiR2-01]|uniref:Uncharacterized protein n=1 Tax=Yersinia phage phiR2-01 TaxID=1206557 RepID=I7LEC8_9CAUD|nr:hypothetical protein BN79_029 [Yersinia phage phiR2-01]CCI88457.1 hypothetical protein BN79_029 [Yersinia phage phiR2-01]
MSIIDNLLDMSMPKALLVLGVSTAAFVGAAGCLLSWDENVEAEEMAKANCVQTQEMRTVSTVETGISSNGSVFTMTGQKIQFKYICDDYPRWK